MRTLPFALVVISSLAASVAACQRQSGTEPNTAGATDPAGPASPPPAVAPAAGETPATPADQAPATAPAPVAAGSGTGRSRIEGCLAAADPTVEAAGKFPARARTRSAGKKQVTVTPNEGGVTVVHELDHACCLKGKVDTNLSGGTVEIVEQLSGTPCRCLCHSTLDTDVTLSAGDWEVVVVVQHHDGRRVEVHREKVSTGNPR